MTIISKKQMSEEDIKLQYITPAITAKWDIKKITMETNITDGKINLRGNFVTREKPKRADYVLYLNSNNPIAIVEAKDCTEEQKQICEINAGMYCFKNRDLFDNLDKLTTNNAQNEYYLTDLVKILANQGKVVKGLVVEDRDEVMGINDCVELHKAYEWMRNRINNNWMKEGVQIVDPMRTVVGKDVKIGHDVIIHPNVEILGNTEIGDFVEILPGTYLSDSKVEAHAVVDSSKVVNSCIKEGSYVGPMSYVSNNQIKK